MDKVEPRPPTVEGTDIRLGLRANLGQFALLVAINALVGGMVGEERTVVPLLAETSSACQDSARP